MRDDERYERLRPLTGCAPTQKEERMQRLDLKTGRRTVGILVPALPWQKEER